MKMIFGQECSGRERIHLSDLWEKKKVIFKIKCFLKKYTQNYE